MFMAVPHQRGRVGSGFQQSGGRAGAANPWRLAFVPAENDPGAGDFGLLDPRLAEEPELPHDGMLSTINWQQAQAPAEELPVPAVKPAPPESYRPVPGPLRDQTLPIPGALKQAYRDDWHPFHHALRRAGMQSDMEIDFARTMFGYEGGMEPNPSNGATAGITGDFLADMGGGDGSLPADPRKLSVTQAAQLYKKFFDHAFDDVHVDRPLTSIRDRKAAGQMIDMLFHWQYDGGAQIQEAMNEIISGMTDEERQQLGLEEVGVDGDVGDVTYAAFNRLLAAGFGTELRNNIADRAERLAINQYKHVPKYLQERIDQFR